MTTPSTAIELSGVTFRYPGAHDDTLRGVDLRIQAGDFVAVVGGNGSGKTTLCKTFNGLVPHFWDGDLDGTIVVNGIDTQQSTVAELSTHVGYVYQDFGNQLVRPTVRDDVAFGPVNFGFDDWRERTERALEALDLGSIATRYTWQLSGGQQHLTAIAGALALSPGVLVVDEPVAEVDPARAHEIYERLALLNRTLGTTIVVIEHHAEFVARYARSVVLMAEGRVRWHLPVREALARTSDLAEADIPAPQVAALVRSFEAGGPVPLNIAEAEEWMRERGLAERAPEFAPGFAPELAPEPPQAARAAGATPTASAELAPIVARASGIRYGYRAISGPRQTVLDDLDLTIREGERVALVGSNGAGKSTLLSLLAGLIVPRDGSVEINGIDTRSVSAAELANDVALLGQRPEEMFLTDSVRSDIAMHPFGRKVSDAAALVDEVIARFELGSVAERDGRLLSGGQQRRATLAIGLAMRPRLLLLDEPTSSLDLRSRDDVIALLADLAEHIKSVVVATHDMHLVAEWADRVLVLEGGKILADLPPAELFASQALLARARLVPPQITQLGIRLRMTPAPLSVPEFVGRLGASLTLGAHS